MYLPHPKFILITGTYALVMSSHSSPHITRNESLFPLMELSTVCCYGNISVCLDAVNPVSLIHYHSTGPYAKKIEELVFLGWFEVPYIHMYITKQERRGEARINK